MINPQESPFERSVLLKYFKYTKRFCSFIIILFTVNFFVLAQCNLSEQYSDNTGLNITVMFSPNLISLLSVTEEVGNVFALRNSTYCSHITMVS